MAQQHSATVRARRLGLALQELRENRGLSFADVAVRLHCHHTKVRRIEKAAVKAEIADIKALLSIYGVEDPRRLELLDWAENAWQRGWWDAYPDVLTGPFPALENDSNLVRSWQAQLIPGMVQTEEYARALISTAVPRPDPDEVHRRVQARLARSALLGRDRAPHFQAILGEAVLRQQVGGDDVMRDQLAHLLKVGQRDNVTIQVLPFTAGAHAGMGGPFIVLSFEHEADPDVAYIENLGGDLYVESEEALARFRLAWGDVADVALPPNESADLIAALAK
jgi:transcriptional regulator with XRE-family HTH domain